MYRRILYGAKAQTKLVLKVFNDRDGHARIGARRKNPAIFRHAITRNLCLLYDI